MFSIVGYNGVGKLIFVKVICGFLDIIGNI